jgi:hypothetical protein
MSRRPKNDCYKYKRKAEGRQRREERRRIRIQYKGKEALGLPEQL